MKTGTLWGPEDFLESKASINFSISPGTVGTRNKELGEFIIKFPLLSFLVKYS